jgi:hypothetical protein
MESTHLSLAHTQQLRTVAKRQGVQSVLLFSSGMSRINLLTITVLRNAVNLKS